MPKYYVIPVDDNGLGYLGIKAGYSPYTHKPWWCGGCPQAFGGNNQGGIPVTLYNETMEESHNKIKLVKRASRYYKKIYEEDNMKFWVCVKFQYNPNTTIPNSLTWRQNHKEYWETTGEILKFDLSIVPLTNRNDVAIHILQVYFKKFARRPKGEHITQFTQSATAEAIRQAAILEQGGGMPSSYAPDDNQLIFD